MDIQAAERKLFWFEVWPGDFFFQIHYFTLKLHFPYIFLKRVQK